MDWASFILFWGI